MTNLHKPERQLIRCLVLILAITLGACSNFEAMREAVARNEYANTVLPQNYKAEILSFMRTYLNDPEKVRGAFVSEPQKRTIENVDRYVVCLRYSARNSSGRYAGSKDSLVLFRSGRLDRIVDNARERCKDAAYKPFPELERMSR